MLPAVRPDQMFPRPCAEYTAHLGEHQAAAFTALWNLHEDPQTNADSAARHIHAALQAPGDGTVKIAPMDVRIELHSGTETVESMYAARNAKAMDVEYVALFSIIAAWSHEFVGQNIDALVHDVREDW